MKEVFPRFARTVSDLTGSPWFFIGAIAVVVIWALLGPTFGYSDTWQLIINTGTTIITFLMVFLIQNTQNRDSRAVHLKLDELIRTTDAARNRLVNLENSTEEELVELQKYFERLRAEYDDRMKYIEKERKRRKGGSKLAS